MNIFIGWWMLPLVLTLIFFWIADRAADSERAGFGHSIVGAIFMLIALIASLMAWLIWAIAT